VRPKPVRPRRAFEAHAAGAGASRPYPPKKPFGGPDDQEQARPYRSARTGRDSGPGRGRVGAAGKTFGTRKPAAGGLQPRTEEAGNRSPARFGAGRPAWKKEDRGARPPASFRSVEGRRESTAGYRGGQSASRPAPGGQRSSDRGRSGVGRGDGGRAFGARPAWNKREGGNRPRFNKGGSGARAGSRPGFESPGSAPSGPRQFRPADSRGDRQRDEPVGGTRPVEGYSRTGQRSSSLSRPPRGEGRGRPFPAGSGKTKTAGARPSARPGMTSARPDGGSRPRTDERSGSRPAGKSGWKPKPNYGGTGRPASDIGKRPPSKERIVEGRSGPRPGAKRPGGRSGKRY
jgi:hypothetical protein